MISSNIFLNKKMFQEKQRPVDRKLLQDQGHKQHETGFCGCNEVVQERLASKSTRIKICT